MNLGDPQIPISGPLSLTTLLGSSSIYFKANGILLAGLARREALLAVLPRWCNPRRTGPGKTQWCLSNGWRHPFGPARIGPQPRTQATRAAAAEPANDPVRLALKKIEEMCKGFSARRRAWLREPLHRETNLKFQGGARPVQQRTDFVRTCRSFQTTYARRRRSGKGVRVRCRDRGGRELDDGGSAAAEPCAVILREEHSLPSNEDEDVDQPYKTPAPVTAGMACSLPSTTRTRKPVTAILMRSTPAPRRRLWSHR